MTLPNSFDLLYKTWHPKVLKLCLGYTGDYDQAQDLVQETFIKVWHHLPTFRGDAQVQTWIYRIAVNTCLLHLRSTRTKPTATADPKDIHNIPDEQAEPDEQIMVLYKCISQLAETDRIIITLVLEDTPYPDIAQVVGISEGNLRVKIHRIKQQLTSIYKQYGRV
nr:sigma-70 family RNA polymerase sigma factor [uncultured Arsenicibacter sp.]